MSEELIPCLGYVITMIDSCDVITSVINWVRVVMTGTCRLNLKHTYLHFVCIDLQHLYWSGSSLHRDAVPANALNKSAFFAIR
jgi:hypothetical protein